LNLSLKTGHVFHAAMRARQRGRASSRRAARPARERTERTATQATALAQRLAEALPRGLLALARGIAAFHFGRWQEAIGLLDRAEQILRGECVGAGYEVTSAQVFRLVALFLLGELRTLGMRMATFIAEARERDDTWADTLLRAGPQVGYWLADDDLPRARAELAYVQQRWPDEAANVPRLWTFIGGLHVDSTAAIPSAAWGRVKREWQEFARSFLFQGQWTRVMLHALRAGAALGACTRTTARASARACCAGSRPTSTRCAASGRCGPRPSSSWCTPGLMVVYRQQERACRACGRRSRAFARSTWRSTPRRRGGAAGSSSAADAGAS
jgi:hypothetical protein